MKRRYVNLTTAVIMAALAMAQAVCQGQGIAWHESLEEAFAAAKKSKKLVMLSLYTDWCPYCEKLKTITWPVQQVIAKSSEFECVEANPEKQPVSDQYNDGSFPRTLFLTAEGEIVHVVPGFVEPEPFVQEMAQAQKNAEKLRQAKEAEKKLADDPENWALAYEIGKLYADIGRAKDALRLLKPVYEHLDQLDEKLRPEAVYAYGVMLLVDRQFETAEVVLARAIEQYPDHERVWQARFALGFALANLDKFAEARAQWLKVAEGDPEGPFAQKAAALAKQVEPFIEGN